MTSLASGPLPYRSPWSHILRHPMVNSHLRVFSSLRPTRKSPSTRSWVGYLAPYLYLVREAILGKPTRRDWDSINHPWPFHVELWLIVEVTGAFPKGGLTRALRMVSMILHVMWEGCLIRAWWRGQKRLLAWHKLKMRYQVPIAC